MNLIHYILEDYQICLADPVLSRVLHLLDFEHLVLDCFLSKIQVSLSPGSETVGLVY